MASPYYNQPQTNPAAYPNWNLPTSNYTQSQNQNRQTFATPPPVRPAYLHGRIVGVPEEVQPNEVPADGSIAIFPLADRSKILVREMTTNGTIADSIYVLDQPLNAEPTGEDFLGPVLKRLDSIERMLRSQKRHPKRPRPGNKTNKESEE